MVKTKIGILDSDQFMRYKPMYGEEKEGSDDLESLSKRITKLKMAKLTRMELDKYLLETERELEKLRGGEYPITELPPAASSLRDILGMYGGDSKKADEVLKNMSPESIRNLMLMTSASSGNPNMMLPIALMTRSEGSPKDIADTVATYVKLAKDSSGSGSDMVTIVDKVISAIRPNKSEEVPIYVNSLIEELKEARKQITEDRLKEIEKKIEDSRAPHPREFIQQFKADAETFGFKSATGGKAGELDLKLEEMRESHELKLAEINLNLQKWVLERQLDSEKWDVVKDMVNPIVAVAGKPIEDKIREMGRGKKEQEKPQKPQEPAQQKEAVINIPCEKCHAMISLNPPYPESFKCPNCGMEYKKDEPQQPVQDRKRVE